MTIESSEEELKSLIADVEKLESKFVQTPVIGERLGAKDIGLFKQLLLDSMSVIKTEFSPLDDHFSIKLSAHTTGSLGPNPSDLHEVLGVLRATVNQIKRIRKNRLQTGEIGIPKSAYVGLKRIAELRAVPTTQWDTRRLVRMLEELNSAHANGMYLTVGMLLRAIADHVPPVFAQTNFEGVASNHSPGTGDARSWKGAMGKLKDAMKHIADSFLHQQIRKKEILPDEPGVEFRAALDLLLAEVVRVLR